MQLSERKALGAYYTPAPLADYLVNWAIHRPGMRVLEPAVGAGSLLRAIERRLTQVGGGQVSGFEIDRGTFQNHLAQVALSGTDVTNADFLAAVPNLERQFDVVVANPPFTRNHALSEVLKARLRDHLGPISPPTGAASLWVYFVLNALRCLRADGRIAFVLPGAAIFSDYFRSVSAHILRSFSSVEMLEVEGKIHWEGEAQERAVLLLASGYENGSAAAIQRKRLCLKTGNVSATQPPALAPVLSHSLLGSIARIEIGFVTGANSHFLLDEERVNNLGLSNEDLVPAVTRCRHILGCHIQASDIASLGRAGERVYLFAPKSLGERGAPSRAHLATISRQKRRSTAWFAKRSPWWAVDTGRTADAAFTYMNHIGPRMSLLEPGIAVSNTLHKVNFNSRSLDQMRTACVSLLTTYTQLHAEVLGRVYGGGVLKFELKDARALPLLIPEQPVSGAVFKRIDTALRSGARHRARELADEAIMPSTSGSNWESLREQMNRELEARRLARGVAPPN